MNREELINQVRKEYNIVLNAYGDFEARMSELDGKMNILIRYPLAAIAVKAFVTILGISICSVPFFVVLFVIAWIFKNAYLMSIGLPAILVLGFIVFNKILGSTLKRKGLAFGTSSYVRSERNRLRNEVSNNLAKHQNDFIVTPQDYRYPYALETVLKMLEQGRANTMAEALNLTDEAIHRGQMEAGLSSVIKTQSDIEYLVRTR